MRPVDGRKPFAGSSLVMRHSIAQPRGTMSSCLNGSRSPAAMRICHCTRSIPVTSSVTGMLDLEARVHLEEVELAVAVEEELAGAGVHVAGGAARRAPPSRPSRAAAPGVTATLGASSIIFWWRRCTEHSRSLSESIVPCWSPSTWISTCRGPTMYFST